MFIICLFILSARRARDEQPRVCLDVYLCIIAVLTRCINWRDLALSGGWLTSSLPLLPPPPPPSPSPSLTYLIHQLISFFPSSLSCPSFMFLSPAWLLRFVTLSTHFVNEALIESFDIGLKRCQIFTGWIDIFFFFSSFWVVVEMMAVIFIENDRFDHCLAVNESIHYFVSSSVLQMPSFSTRDVFLLN